MWIRYPNLIILYDNCYNRGQFILCRIVFFCLDPRYIGMTLNLNCENSLLYFIDTISLIKNYNIFTMGKIHNNNSDFLNIIDSHLINSEIDTNILEKEFRLYILGFKKILQNAASTGAYDLVQQLKDDLITIKSKRIKCCICNTKENCENKALILRYIEKAICYIESEYQVYVLGKIFPDFTTIKHGDLSNSGLYFNGSQSDI